MRQGIEPFRPDYVCVDLHTHNTFSTADATATPKEIAERLRKLGMTYATLGITNHNTVDGANEVLDACKNQGLEVTVIKGEEITLAERNPAHKRGELIGLFLQETIPTHSTIDQVVASIRQQRGVLVIPHMNELWRHGIGSEMAEEIITKAYEAHIPVAVEIFNARATSANNRQTRQFAHEWNRQHPDKSVLFTAGSDAHYWREYGHRAFLHMSKFDGRDDFIESLSRCNGFTCRRDDDGKRTSFYRTLNRIALYTGIKL